MSDTPVPVPERSNSRGRVLWSILVILLLVTIAFRVFCGFYTIQPIGALPEGRTLVVWRASGEPFFNSPDAMCLKRVGSVSLMCRLIALGEAPTDRIVLRLPYIASAYRASTGGREFVSPNDP
jgi:hypothetical protein